MNKDLIHKKSSFELYVFGMLISLELLMSFTFLGYIHIPPVSATIAYIPTVLAGCLLSPVHSAIAGFVCGAASMYKASASYVMGGDMIFSPFLSGRPIGSFILSIGTRTLFGLLIGLAFALAKKGKHYRVRIGIISALAPLLHAFLVYSAMNLFFSDIGYNSTNVFRFNFSNIIQPLICIVITVTCHILYNCRHVRNFKNCVDRSDSNPYIENEKKHIFIVFFVFLLLMTIFAAFYFSRRTSYMLSRHNIEISPVINNDLIHLQIQFLFAMLSLNSISVILLISEYKYMTYRKYLGELDSLTGVMGYSMFYNHCGKLQTHSESLSTRDGWFLFLDVDYFKAINDTLGHLVGDNILKEVAAVLQNIFSECGSVGRIGGDEFAAIIEKQISRKELEQKLDYFLDEVAKISSAPNRLSCSIGVCRFTYPTDMSLLPAKTDKMLYEAKKKGRACYVIGDYTSSN